MQDCLGMRRLLMQKVSKPEPRGNWKPCQVLFPSLPALSIFFSWYTSGTHQFRGSRWLLVHMHCFSRHASRTEQKLTIFFLAVYDMPTVGNETFQNAVVDPSCLLYFQTLHIAWHAANLWLITSSPVPGDACVGSNEALMPLRWLSLPSAVT